MGKMYYNSSIQFIVEQIVDIAGFACDKERISD